MNRFWILAIAALWLVFLAAMRSRKTGRSALYVIAAKLQYVICLSAALLPTVATFIEEIPERLAFAWRRERGRQELEVMHRKSA